jgi:hypothetical protein
VHVGGDYCPFLKANFSIEALNQIRVTPRNKIVNVPRSVHYSEAFSNVICEFCHQFGVARFALIPCGHMFCGQCVIGCEKCYKCSKEVFAALRTYPSFDDPERYKTEEEESSTKALPSTSATADPPVITISDSE